MGAIFKNTTIPNERDCDLLLVAMEVQVLKSNDDALTDGCGGAFG